MPKPLHILFVAEADAPIVPEIVDELRRADYEVDGGRVDSPAGLRAALEQPSWDVIVCDYELNAFSAASALALLRESGHDIPFLLISQANQPQEMRNALSLGANDLIRRHYLPRLVPAIEREVSAARVRAARILTEAALRQAEARYQQLVDQIPVGVHVMALDANSSTLSISPQIERMLGFSQAEWVADSELWQRQIHPEDRERVVNDLKHVYTPGAKPYIGEYRMQTRDGQEVWIHDEALLIRDQAGQPVYLQSVKMDVSGRKRAEEEAQAIEQRMADWVKGLEQSHREVSLLDEMSTRLQACVSLAEMYPVLGDFVQLLFPPEAGALYLLNENTSRFELTTAWGRTPPGEPEFGVDDCQAFRRGKLFAADIPPMCQHVTDPINHRSLCVPLVAQGETLGILHLRLRRGTAVFNQPENQRSMLSEDKQKLANSVAERLALALGNLRRQAILRAKVEALPETVANGTAAARAEMPTTETSTVVPPKRITVGALTLNVETFELAVGDKVVNPTPVEFELLQFLMRNAGRVFTAEQLLQEVWKYPPGTGSQEVVRAHVRNLRAKMEPNPRQPIYLRTNGRFGYTIALEEAPVEKTAEN
ncbi:MAG: PAS domain-containing protein [Anaerolineales bacterium]|nr:PAS domain-containing protein [Anaerolineales bacterium]